MKKLILIDDMEEGMILASPIKNRFGQVLLGADSRLELKHINLFRTWGIESIYVFSEEGDSAEGVNEAVMNEAKEILAKRIQWSPKNENEEDLINLGLERIIEKLVS
jgi:hypothetical protein